MTKRSQEPPKGSRAQVGKGKTDRPSGSVLGLLKRLWWVYVGLALFMAAWPNAEKVYWQLKSGRAWIGSESARLYLQDPGDWRDSVVTYGFPLQEDGLIVPFETITMINVLWTSPQWAERDVPFVCVKSSDGTRMGWIEISFPAWVVDVGPQYFEWEDEERGGMYWEVACEAEWYATGFSVEHFPVTGYVSDMEWERVFPEGEPVL